MVLEKIENPKDLRIIDKKLLQSLADEIREEIISATSKNGGHIAPSLGVIELTVALHYVFNTPEDKIVWDVGHQAYAHKLLTGRTDRFRRLRQLGGISGFPNRSESRFDAFGTGHSSTSISAALGMACARDLKGEDFKVIAVIGDGALTGGMALEALNNAGHLKKDILVILNDNEMFISGKVGALGEYLTRILTFAPVYKVEERVRDILERHPHWGKELIRLARRSKAMLTPGMLFEELGFKYLGPVDGHDLNGMIDVLKRVKDIRGPRILHVITKKGKGYAPAEKNPEMFHGTGAFDVSTGEAVSKGGYRLKYQDVLGDTLVELARADKRITAITAAMASGTGLDTFRDKYPDRFFDVGIAEQHAVTFAAGLAAEGLKPVCAIYSTFLQRSYDQIIHDVALQELPVIFALDRAGLVGEDGPTHHGMFDLSYMTSVPNMVVCAPADENEMRNLLYSALKWEKPVSMRYPRGQVQGIEVEENFRFIEPGTAEVVRKGRDITIMAIGSMVYPSIEAVRMLEEEGISAGLVNLRFAKPLDTDTIFSEAASTGKVLIVEENIVRGGVGEWISSILPRSMETGIMGIPDSFVTYGKISQLKDKLGLTPEGIRRNAVSLFKNATRKK